MLPKIDVTPTATPDRSFRHLVHARSTVGPCGPLRSETPSGLDCNQPPPSSSSCSVCARVGEAVSRVSADAAASQCVIGTSLPVRECADGPMIGSQAVELRPLARQRRRGFEGGATAKTGMRLARRRSASGSPPSRASLRLTRAFSRASASGTSRRLPSPISRRRPRRDARGRGRVRKIRSNSLLFSHLRAYTDQKERRWTTDLTNPAAVRAIHRRRPLNRPAALR